MTIAVYTTSLADLKLIIEKNLINQVSLTRSVSDMFEISVRLMRIFSFPEIA